MNVGEYFVFPNNLAMAVARAGGSAEEVIALLILYRGAGIHTSSGWGENAIRKYAGMTYSRAQQATKFLQENGFIKLKLALTKACAPTNRPAKSRWQIVRPDYLPIYLPNELVDGTKHGNDSPPLCRLYTQARPALAQHIDFSNSRLDSILMLLEFYARQNIARFGGVDTQCWYKPWRTRGAEETDSGADQAIGTIFDIEKDIAAVSTKMASQVFIHIECEDYRMRRYLHAISNLMHLGLAYEVLQVWNADPIECLSAEWQYPLYIFDRQARTSEPCIYKQINRIGIDWDEIRYGSESYNEAATRCFRFFTFDTSWIAGSVLRMRYRAHDLETGIGMQEQRLRSEHWIEELNLLQDQD